MIHDYKILESDSDHDNESPLHLSLPLISLQPNNFEMRGVKLELLLHLGKIILDIDIESDYMNCVEIVLDNGFDVNSKNSYGSKLLHYAACDDHINIEHRSYVLHYVTFGRIK